MSGAPSLPELRYADLFVGRAFSDSVTPITPALVADYAAAVGNGELARQAADPAGTPLRDPTLGILFAITRRVIAKEGTAPPGGVLAGQDCVFHRLVRMGETITTRSSITEKFERRGRNYIVLRCAYFGGSGEEVGHIDNRIIWAA